MMKAAAIDRFGPPSVLKLRELPVPEIDDDEVLVRLAVAGVGFWDAKIRDGTWAEGKLSFPLVLGTDGAGVVQQRGASVRRVAVGDKVWAYSYDNPKGGFYAEYVAVDANDVARIPRLFDFLQAGASAVTALTAVQGIDDHLEVKRSETVLIFGASGAVGTLALQFAKRRGARVFGTGSGDEAKKLVLDLGADAVFDARGADPAAILEALAPNGVDATLACAGGPALERCLERMRRGGRVAYPNGVEPPPKKRPNIRVTAYDATTGPKEWAHLERAVLAAKLRVPIAELHPLEDAWKAHARIEKGHVLGRIALRIRRT